MTESEEFQALKIKLETEIQNLQQQLAQMRATCQLNSEKLEYSFQVLKKRDEENMLTLTQQKRRINRLQDQLSTLRKKLVKEDKQSRDTNAQLTEDYRRITEQFQDLQKKFRHFHQIDMERYDQVWQMREDECVEVASRGLAADKVSCHAVICPIGCEGQRPSVSTLPVVFLTLETCVIDSL